MSDSGEEIQAPPPASQSHFAKFENFIPDDDAPFEIEFERLASSQEWVLGSQEYTRERTIAMREELKLHYFSQPLEGIKEEIEDERQLTEEERLRGYQALCDEVRIQPSNTILDCERQLKSTLVNIVDLIDARRVKAEVKVWDDFDSFRRYTLLDKSKRIDPQTAKGGDGLLALFLRHLRAPRTRRRKQPRRGRPFGVASGRVQKREPIERAVFIKTEEDGCENYWR